MLRYLQALKVTPGLLLTAIAIGVRKPYHFAGIRSVLLFIDYGVIGNHHPAVRIPVKGAGEAGALVAPPVVIAAIADALRDYGVTHIDMPATPERVWQAMQAEQAAE